VRDRGRAVLIVIGLAGWLAATALAMLVVARLGFFGPGIIGVATWFICVRIELEKDGAVGSVFSPGFYSEQIRAREGMSRSDRAAHRHEASALVYSLRFFKQLGIGLTAIGFGVFALTMARGTMSRTGLASGLAATEARRLEGLFSPTKGAVVGPLRRRRRQI
jgi:hypothetical protein